MINFQKFINENINEAFNFSKEEVLKVAHLVAHAIEKLDKAPTRVHDLEYDKGRGAAFGIQMYADQFAGGAYTVLPNGDVVNDAIGNSFPNAIYAKIGDTDVKKVMKNIQKFESVVTEAKKFYSTKEIAKISNAAGDIVVDAKYAIQDLSVAYGDKVPAKELDKVLTNYDLEIEDLTESMVTEGKKVTLKRRYTESYPAITAGKHARIRNKMLEAIGNDGKITQEEFDSILKELSSNGKRWTRNNSKYFNVSEEGISLSKFGKRALQSITVNEEQPETNDKPLEMKVNEKTTKNPEIWVPGALDKELSKIPNSQITYDVVKKLAKKHKVFLDDAIKYVEYGWDIELKENKTNMKTQFIYESFSDFVNSLNKLIVTEGITNKDVKVGAEFKVGKDTFKVDEIENDKKLGTLVKTSRVESTSGKKYSYQDFMGEFVDFLNDEKVKIKK